MEWTCLVRYWHTQGPYRSAAVGADGDGIPTDCQRKPFGLLQVVSLPERPSRRPDWLSFPTSTNHLGKTVIFGGTKVLNRNVQVMGE